MFYERRCSVKIFKFMKSTTIRLFQVLFKNTTFFFLDEVRRGECFSSIYFASVLKDVN
jgi:hypothetical protein